MAERLELKYNLFFGGMKHCGKSTHGRFIAEKFTFPFDDLDNLIEKLYLKETGTAKTFREIFKERGREGFQKLEYDALATWLKAAAVEGKNGVLALGGGVASNPAVLKLLKSGGKFVYIKQPEELLYERIIRKGVPPFLDEKRPQESFSELYRQRTAVYEQAADLTVDPDRLGLAASSEFILERITDYLNQIS